MKIKITFYSYFRDLAGTAEWETTVPEGSSLQIVLESVWRQFPKVASMKGSALVAVGVDYQTKDYLLKEGDEVSLFPPVQGG